MIEPMKKVHLIFHSSEWTENLKELQHLGMVDINYGAFDVDSEKGYEYQEIKDAFEVLDSYEESNMSIEYQHDGDINHRYSAYDVAKNINQLSHEKHLLIKENQDFSLLVRELGIITKNISTKDLEQLSNYKMSAHIYKVNKKIKNIEVTENVYSKLLLVSESHSYWLIIEYDGTQFEVPVTWTEYKLADSNVTKIEESIRVNEKQIEEIDLLLRKELEYTNTLQVRKIELENQLLSESVKNSGQIYEDQLLVVEGFFPERQIKNFNEFVENKSWGVVISKPTEEDNPPTLLRTFKFVKILNPLMKLMDTVPGYKEFDISLWFLLFLTLFYSMILGDAGYGSLMLIGTLVFVFRDMSKGKVGLVHALFLWFSLATVIWGAVTGNWFGYAPLAKIPLLKSMIIPSISMTNPTSSETIQLFSFRIGIVHLLLAHTWRMIRMMKVSFWKVIYELSQSGLLLGLFYVTLNLLLDANKYPIPSFVIPLIAVSFGIAAITGEQEKGKSFLKGAGKGIAFIPLSFLGAMGNLADIISYIRLFAVGLASLAIAQSFNTMGFSVMEIEAASPILSFVYLFAGILVIGFGHALNLAMALLAVMVHGVRLNLLEFGMHLGMEWTGRKYTPFQKKILSLEEK